MGATSLRYVFVFAIALLISLCAIVGTWIYSHRDMHIYSDEHGQFAPALRANAALQHLLPDRARFVPDLGSNLFSTSLTGNFPQDSSNLQVFVVEEHHEALLYWAATKPTPQAALLVHIDAHPDFAAPRKMTNSTVEQIGSSDPEKSVPGAYLPIYNNDEFIIQACQLGIVSAAVWIYPIWDAQGRRHKRQPSDLVTPTGIGHDDSGDICVCKSSSTPLDLDNSEFWVPSFQDHVEESSCLNFEDEEIPLESCSIQTSCPLITLSESSLQNLRGHQFAVWQQFLGSFPGSILDVDEDFFARISEVSRTVYALGRKTLGAINRVLSELCPSRDPNTESAAHVAFLQAVRLVQDCLKRGPLECSDSGAAQLAAFDCHGKKSSKAFAKLVAKLDDSELELLASVGLCLSTSAATDPSIDFQFRVCSEGRPDDEETIDTDMSLAETVLAEDKVAVDRRLSQFAQWFPGSVRDLQNYSVVTVCRSVRDGYLPRRVWANVEAGILKALGGNVHFDHLLMGGKAGRPM